MQIGPCDSKDQPKTTPPSPHMSVDTLHTYINIQMFLKGPKSAEII